MTSADAGAVKAAGARLASIDAYRGFVMLLMMAEVLEFRDVSKAIPTSSVWRFLASQQSHSPWQGCTLHDMIQPSFSFIVGVALPFSIASRSARGESRGRMVLHAAWRSIVLILLGVFLRSMHSSQTNWTFEDTLTQIGLGYVFLFALGLASVRTQWIATAAILVGTWMAFVLYPLPPPGFDRTTVKVDADWAHDRPGIAAHWNKNTNAAMAFDRWFMNRLPRPEPFVANGGGYATLSFVPTLATMLLGLIAGGWLRSGRPPRETIRRFAIAAVIAIAAGCLLDITGICPSVKRIWTPAWVLFSGGWCFALLAAFHGVVDVAGRSRWAFPLIVIGANSIAAYWMAHVMDDLVDSSLTIHLGEAPFRVFGPAVAPAVHGAAVLAVFWLILAWMYRRRLFLRV